MTVAAEIKVIARELGVSQGLLAKQAHMSRASLSLKLNGRRDMTLPEVERLAAALGTTPLSASRSRAQRPCEKETTVHQSDLLLGLQSDPFVTSVLIGIMWPLVQAWLDRPYWTHQRRVWLTVPVAVAMTAGVWASGSYPVTWKVIISQASVFLGVAWTVFQILSGIKIGSVSIIDWVRAPTPGGETIDDVRAGAGEAVTRGGSGGEMQSRAAPSPTRR